MSDDLVSRLERADGIGACLSGDARFVKSLCQEAAQALTEARAEIERLRAVIDRVARVDNSLAKQLRASIENNASLVGELSTLRARVREVVGPFAAWISAVDAHPAAEFPDHAATEIGPHDDKSPVKITGADFRAARQLNEDLKSRILPTTGA